MVADFWREYQVRPDELAAMSVGRFQLLVTGLSRHSRFAAAWADAPKHLYDPSDIAAVKAAARR